MASYDPFPSAAYSEARIVSLAAWDAWRLASDEETEASTWAAYQASITVTHSAYRSMMNLVMMAPAVTP